MATDVLTNFGNIEQELEKAKSNLKGLNENIRRMIGRDPPDIQLRGDRKRTFNQDQRRSDRGTYGGGGGGNNSLDRNRNRSGGGDLSPPSSKRRQSNPDTKSVFSRLSGPPSRNNNDDDQLPTKPKITSRIIRELPTRQEIVAAQGSDAASRARNRRMFGSLLGTLQKFCQEESRLKPKEEKKAQIEKKLEDQQKKERETLRKERLDLYKNRKQQQMEIKMLEMKMNRMKELTMLEDAKKPLMNFIRTKSKPKIYYLPKVMNKKTEKKLADCRTDIEKSIAKKRSEVEDELAIIAGRFKTFDGNKLQIGDDGNDADQSIISNASMNVQSSTITNDKIQSEKHDRRTLPDDDEDDEEDDSFYNNSPTIDDADDDQQQQRQKEQQNDECIVVAPAITIIKVEDGPSKRSSNIAANEDNHNDKKQQNSIEEPLNNEIKSENLFDEIVTQSTVSSAIVTTLTTAAIE